MDKLIELIEEGITSHLKGTDALIKVLLHVSLDDAQVLEVVTLAQEWERRKKEKAGERTR